MLDDVLTPKEIVAELDKYIISQGNAKRMVAIALRNRWRRQQVPEEMRDEIVPKNIIMIGSTGVGKTEISRRLAKLSGAAFIKVEASKFTEVGYVGRDVESIIRDLTDIAVKMVKDEQMVKVNEKAKQAGEERLLDLLLTAPGGKISRPAGMFSQEPDTIRQNVTAAGSGNREELKKQLRAGLLDDDAVELDVKDTGGSLPIGVISNAGMEGMDFNLKDMIGKMFPSKTKKFKTKVREALKILAQEEAQKLIDMDEVVREAITRVEQHGIVFLDEIDKIVGRGGAGGGPDVSREGVQRDLLPIIEGCSVNTKYGHVNTDHVLFIASGAFHTHKPSDMIPELQGRFPIRVELESLGENEFYQILTEPKNALIKQYIALMKTEGIVLEFEESGIREIARTAWLVNEKTENIGARRLFTIMEKLLEDLSFEGPDSDSKHVKVDKRYVSDRLANIAEDEDLSKYIL